MADESCDIIEINKEVSEMGMTDHQFDSYQKRTLKILEQAQAENIEKGVENTILADLIETIREELQR